MQNPLLIFDGECGFCRIWVEYWKRLTGGRVSSEPYQKVADEFPDIPRERFARSAHLALPDGEVLTGAHAVFRALAFAPGRTWPLFLYRHVPGFAALTEWLYRFIAAHRPLFFRATILLFGPVVEPSSYVRVRWLFLKLLGAIYGIAFLSLWFQITGLIGSRGILPFGRVSDLALQLACAVGVACSILLIAGILERTALIACWGLYLSLTTAGQDFLSFQWDILLLETGFLAIFLGSSPVIVWLFRWLLFRLMLLSGAVKLLSGDAAWRTLTALNFHYYTQPLPTRFAWYMQQLPGWFQEASVVVMFAIELGTPFLIFAPRRIRFFAGFWILFLQTLILLTGNYTYFNLLTIALCVFLLDDQALGTHYQPARKSRKLVPALVAALILFLSVSQLLGIAPRVQRALAPFYLTNTYGLFAVMTTVRNEIIVEGSNDGAQWREYEFRYKPGDVRHAPRWAAPHQPRLDWQMWFAALGSYRTNPWFVNFVLRLLEGSPDVTSLLDRNPFPGAPPRYIRALTYEYTFTDWQTRRTTGAWWRREPRGTYLPPVSLR